MKVWNPISYSLIKQRTAKEPTKIRWNRHSENNRTQAGWLRRVIFAGPSSMDSQTFTNFLATPLLELVKMTLHVRKRKYIDLPLEIRSKAAVSVTRDAAANWEGA